MRKGLGGISVERNVVSREPRKLRLLHDGEVAYVEVGGLIVELSWGLLSGSWGRVVCWQERLRRWAHTCRAVSYVL